jgi:putative chitinase
MHIDRDKFYAGFRQHFGALHQDLVDAINALLDAIEADTRFDNPADPVTGRQQLAYCLATFDWETAHTLRPIDEYGGTDYFNQRYGPQTAVGKQLGNTEAGDGARFHGRGYVQLTGRTNYARAGKQVGADLLGDPDQAKNPPIAWRIASTGMLEGWFTGKRLDAFFRQGQMPQWEDARTIINGHDQAGKIALLGRQFDDLLVHSLIGAAA